MLLDGRCRVIGVACTLILLIKANGNICEALRKVSEVHPEDALVIGVWGFSSQIITYAYFYVEYCIIHV